MKCAKLGCSRIGTKACSACLRECYCSAECQKKDWKTHKIVCHLIKKMPDTLLPYNDVCSVVAEALNETEVSIVKLGSKRYVRLLQHITIFAKHQFGKRIAGKSVYERGNGERIDSWNVEITVFIKIYMKSSQCIAMCDKGWSHTIPYLQKALAILEPWRLQIDLSEKERIHVLEEQQIDHLFALLSEMEHRLGNAYGQLQDMDKAEHYCKLSIKHAKQITGGDNVVNIQRVFNLLSFLGTVYRVNSRPEVKALREEAYIYVSEAYNPEHPLVLEAAGQLIMTLGDIVDYYDAERFARICYEALIRPPLDPDSYEAAKAADNLSHASYNMLKENRTASGDLDEADMLARKALRIIKDKKGTGFAELIIAFHNLVLIKTMKKDCGDETMILFEDFLSDLVRDQGKDHKITAIVNAHLARFHFDIMDTSLSDEFNISHLRKSDSHFKEALPTY